MENPVIAFELEYAAELVYCEAVMHDHYYNILFNGQWVARIEHNDECQWMLASGVILPQETVDEIGTRIESNYK